MDVQKKTLDVHKKESGPPPPPPHCCADRLEGAQSAVPATQNRPEVFKLPSYMKVKDIEQGEQCNKNLLFPISIEKISSTHLFIVEIQQISESHGVKGQPICAHVHSIIIELTFSFPEFVPVTC